MADIIIKLKGDMDTDILLRISDDGYIFRGVLHNGMIKPRIIWYLVEQEFKNTFNEEK